MKKSLLLSTIVFFSCALSAQLRFDKVLDQNDFNDPTVVVGSAETTAFDASTQTLALKKAFNSLIDVGDALKWNESYVDVALEGAPLEMSFDIAYNTPKVIEIFGVKFFDDGCGFTLPTVLGMDNSSDLGKPMFWLAESADGVTYTTTHSWRQSKKDVYNSSSDASKGFGYKHKSVRLKETTRFVRLGYRANFQGLYRNIIVTPLHSDLQLDINPRALDFGRMHHNTADQSDDKTMTVDAYWRNLKDITLSVEAYKSTAAQQMYSLSDMTLGTNEVSNGEKIVDVTNHPSAAVGEYNVTKANANGAIIRIHAASPYPNDERICNIPLSVQTCQDKRTITWYEGQDTIVVRNEETLEAATIAPQKTGVKVAYRIVESKGTATINTTTRKTSAAPTVGVVVMEAYWNGSGTYADACVRRTFVVLPEHGYLYESSLCKGDSIEMGGQKIYADVNKTEIITLRTADDQADSTIVVIMTVHNHVDGITDAVRVAEYDLPYTWEGMTFTEADTKLNVLKTRYNCDSAVTMTVSVMPTYYRTDTVCQDEFPIWVHYLGKDAEDKDIYDTIHVFTDYGVATHVFSTENGDSAMQYKVVPYDTIYADTTYFSMCYGDSIEWFQQVYKEAGTYRQDTLNDCGTTVVNVLSLLVQMPTNAPVEDTTICAADTALYRWHDMAFTESGIYYATDTFVSGCDSVYYELHLTVQSPKTAPVENTMVCAENYTWHGRLLTENGTYYATDTFTTGCDSVYYELHLTIGTSVQTEFNDTTCPAKPYLWEGDTYTESGDYTKTLATGMGCDSIVTLHLVVTMPNPDADPALDRLPASNKFNAWLLMLDKAAVEEQYQLLPSESDVTWYRVVGEVDSQISGATKDDQPVGQGFYYTDDRHLTDAYYALINVPAAATEDGCGAIYRSQVLNTPSNMPLLLTPTRVAPSAALQLRNLDASPTTIRVYNMAGQQVNEYRTAGNETFVMRAAMTKGVYLMRVTNETQNETLRYMVVE